MNLEQFASRGLKAQAEVDVAVAKAEGGMKNEETLKALNSMPLINRRAVRDLLLEHAKATRPFNKFNRVSEETLREIHEAVRQMAMARVHRAPSKGRTL